jgi:hypothetical protein
MSKRILDLQARFSEVGRIRLGEKQGNRPAKIDNLRFTSQNRDLLDQIATLYQGEVTPWESPRGAEWQCYIQAEEIDIIIPPSDESITTSYEIWSGGGMQRYCDGVTMKRPGDDEERSCQCAEDIMNGGERECKIKARMITWLPKIQTLGVWRLETGSWYAAGELTKMIDMLLDASMQLQRAVTAKLRLDRRVVKRDGKTFRFNVPIITPVGDVAVILEASTPMAALPEARDVLARPDRAALPAAAPLTSEWPSDEPSNLEGYVEPVDNSVDNEYVEPVENSPDDLLVKGKHTQLMITLEAVGYTPDERHELVAHVTEGAMASTKQLRYRHLPKMWERITTRATSEVQKLFIDLWAEPTRGWAILHEVIGLEAPVADWKLNEWLLALSHCQSLTKEMESNDGK